MSHDARVAPATELGKSHLIRGPVHRRSVAKPARHRRDRQGRQMPPPVGTRSDGARETPTASARLEIDPDRRPNRPREWYTAVVTNGARLFRESLFSAGFSAIAASGEGVPLSPPLQSIKILKWLYHLKVRRLRPQ